MLRNESCAERKRVGLQGGQSLSLLAIPQYVLRHPAVEPLNSHSETSADAARLSPTITSYSPGRWRHRVVHVAHRQYRDGFSQLRCRGAATATVSDPSFHPRIGHDHNPVMDGALRAFWHHRHRSRERLQQVIALRIALTPEI